ncbi:Acetyltransferase [Chitinispirillum alkaliphilum]|nr:Acetyltransferase [Chitinispirillum alkaliphilum]
MLNVPRVILCPCIDSFVQKFDTHCKFCNPIANFDMFMEGNMKLEEASLNPPYGLRELLTDVGGGENGFSGTLFNNGQVSLESYLKSCCDGKDVLKLKPNWIPQTIFWLLDTYSKVVGMIRVRHYLSESTRINGGHIGFFIHSSHRRKGYGKQALALALDELKKLGETEALVTAYPENLASIKVIEANGGQLENTIFDPRTEHDIARYWIRL